MNHENRNRPVPALERMINRDIGLFNTAERNAHVSTMKTYLSRKELESYSISRGILATAGAKRLSCLETEVSDAFCHENQAATSGFIVPPEVLFGVDQPRVRTIGATTGPSGGYTVGLAVGGMIDFLFPQSVVMRLGAQFLGGLTRNVGLPRGVTSDEGEWLAEGQTASASHSSTFGEVMVVPKRIYAERTVTLELLKQTVFGDALVSSILMGACAAAIDRAALVGTGDVQPLGLMNDSNVTAVSSGTNGGAPTLSILTTAEGTPIGNKVPMTRAGWVVSPNARTKLKTTQTASGTSTFLLMTDENQDYVNGFTAYPTALLSDALTKGSGTSLGSALFGADWSTLSVAQFGGLEIVSDIFTQAKSGNVIVFMNALADIAKRRPEAFAKVNDMITT